MTASREELRAAVDSQLRLCRELGESISRLTAAVDKATDRHMRRDLVAMLKDAYARHLVAWTRHGQLLDELCDRFPLNPPTAEKETET